MITKSNPYIEKAPGYRSTVTHASGYSNSALDKFKRPTATKFCEVDFQGDTEKVENNVFDCSNEDAEQPKILAIYPSESPLKPENIGNSIDMGKNTVNVLEARMNHELQDSGNNHPVLHP